RVSGATLHEYRSMVPAEAGQDAEILPDQGNLLGLRLAAGGDTLNIRDWDFAPSAEALTADPATPLIMTASRGGVTVELRYGFRPDNYLVTVDGRITGLGPNGGTLLVGMGPGIRNTEVDSVEHQRNLAVVTKSTESKRTDFGGLDREAPTDLSGPFEWVAIKSKYFVAAVFAVDTVASGRSAGRIAGVRAVPTDTRKRPAEVDVQATLPVAADGAFRFALYAGPMEYPRLRGMGHDFYDVNPYGWPGFRTIIRPVAVAARWLLVKMHELGIAYGLGLVIFGIMIRVVLWPLNQKAMRASMQMQVIQPILKDLQDRHKDDPAKLQQEMFKVYKEYKVNPLGGCWPMLLPMPVLFALFFVFQNTIELRGAPFLWIDDLSRADPLYIIPVAMGLSMYLVSKIGQLGMAPNPQMKIMLYMMPAMMTVLFLNFASGLNLYYAVQNLASIPQQWLLAKERIKANPPKPAPPPPPAKKPEGKGRR
ncbi:MAG TPA: YidC/Oxa1 family insertase periplasmic-domain containing protein, partial [Gemmatimonadales bacterium]|nr:YidC/Oxa1 family insertase periplasmic-domain containing protein [Gemmatimonadales bacterium]